MRNIKSLFLDKKATIKEALEIIDNGKVKIAIIVDKNNKLLGTISDGDVRRAILKSKTLNDSIEDVYFQTPTFANINDSKEEIIKICVSKKIHQIPIVDNDGKVVQVDILDELLKPESYNNKVILMVGGLGTRLRPMTNTTPKPMLLVGEKPILQTIVAKFVEYGFTNIIMCIGYKSQIIQDYFGDGSNFGANIEYVLEDTRMGTAGALSLISNEQKPQEPFFVMNGDLLTNINFEHLLNYHVKNKSKATMCVREYDFQVPYGVVKVKDGVVKAIDEKPIHKFFVSAGIYMLNPSCLDLIPKDKFYDMPTLFEKLIEIDEKIVSFPIREYWLDIGGMEEYKKANDEYHQVF